MEIELINPKEIFKVIYYVLIVIIISSIIYAPIILGVLLFIESIIDGGWHLIGIVPAILVLYLEISVIVTVLK